VKISFYTSWKVVWTHPGHTPPLIPITLKDGFVRFTFRRVQEVVIGLIVIQDKRSNSHIFSDNQLQIMKAPLFVTLFMLLFCTPRLIAQCMLAEVPLPDRVEQSSHIIEGEVIAKRSFWDDTRRNIFTANRIKVYKSFKGVLETGEIELITRGGVVDMDAQRDFPSLQVKGEDLGIFFLTDNREDIDSETDPTRPVFQPTTGPQGFIQFDKDYGTAYDPFHTYNDVPALYAALEKLTGEKVRGTQSF
jgi:hypothetical protein